MDLKFIQEFQVALRNLEDLPAQPADDAAGREQIIPLATVPIGAKLTADHVEPPPKRPAEPGTVTPHDRRRVPAPRRISVMDPKVPAAAARSKQGPARRLQIGGVSPAARRLPPTAFGRYGYSLPIR